MTKFTDIKAAWSERRELRQAYVRVFSGVDGERVLRDLANLGFLTRCTFAPGDSHKTSLNEGARRLVLDIFRRAKKDPKPIITQNIEDEA